MKSLVFDKVDYDYLFSWKNATAYQVWIDHIPYILIEGDKKNEITEGKTGLTVELREVNEYEE